MREIPPASLYINGGWRVKENLILRLQLACRKNKQLSSPKLAAFIQDKEALKQIIRRCLKPFVWTASKLIHTYPGIRRLYLDLVIHITNNISHA